MVNYQLTAKKGFHMTASKTLAKAPKTSTFQFRINQEIRKCAEMGICKINIYTDYIVAALQKTYDSPQASWPAVMKQAEETIAAVHAHYDQVLRG